MEPNKEKLKISFVLPTFNERRNINLMLKQLLDLNKNYETELIVVDDNSKDGTAEIVREISKKEKNIKLINRIDRFGLASAIKEGCINASNEIIAIMDTDGQHKVEDIINAAEKLFFENLDVVIGSRFAYGASINGLSQDREKGSIFANKLAKYSLSKHYSHLSDLMTGCIVLKRKSCIDFLKKVEVNGFKFLYELLSISKGSLKVGEIPLSFQPRKDGFSKLDIAVIWDFFVSLSHTFLKRSIPRKAISFGFVGSIGIFVQLISFYSLIIVFGLNFELSLPIAVILAASSNFFINNWLTFRSKRLKNKKLILGLLKFLIVSSLPIFANVGLATSFYNYVTPNTFISQMAGIIIVFIWNYAASSRFVWEI